MRMLSIVCLCLLSGACVAKTKYEALSGELERTQSELAGAHDAAARHAAEADRQLASARVALDQCAVRVDRLEGDSRRDVEKIVELEQAALALEADLMRVQHQLAQLVKDRSRLGASVEEMQRALASMLEREREAKRRIAEYRDMLARFQDMIDAGKLQVRVVDGRMVLTLSMDILFATGSARLSKEGRESLLDLGKRLASLPDRRFQVEGHTDTVPIHTASYPSNWELASARALVVVRALLDAGMPPERVSAASFGEHRPTADNESEAGRTRNRRIELVLVPDLTGLPGHEELNKLAGQ